MSASTSVVKPLPVSRRSFLGGSLGALAAVALPGGAFAGGRDRIRLGLIGCGGRGTGAAMHALAADAGAMIVAVADASAVQLDDGLAMLAAHGAGRVDCPAERRFVGPDAWRGLLAADVDAVILATPPAPRPAQAAAAIAAGRHVFCETPAGVDAAGVRRLLVALDDARARGLSFATGLWSRHHAPIRETVAAIHAGTIGAPRHAVAVARVGLPWRRPVPPAAGAAAAEALNWIWHPRLSGGHFVERHVHAIDRMLWAFGDEPPVTAEPTGPGTADFAGTAVRYRFADGRGFVAALERRAGCVDRIVERVFGGLGSVDLHAAPRRSGSLEAVGDPRAAGMAAFIAGLRHGRPTSDGATLCRATHAAIMGRTAAEQGRVVDSRALWAG